MQEITDYYLVDLENVGLQGLYGLNLPEKGSEVHIFLSNMAHAGTEEIRQDILDSKANFETTFCSSTGKNALDFQLAAYFGAILEKPATRRISIISNDSGYRSLDDYAKKRRKNVIVYLGHSVLEAFVASKNRSNPRMYEKSKPVDFKHIMAEIKARKDFEKSIRISLEGTCDEEEIKQVIDLAGSEEISLRDTYLSLLKIFGRTRGAEIYRGLKEARRGQ